jgi:AcrR family transcriptional regulator
VTAPARIDRRQRRRLETIEEIVDVAVEVMTEHGVGGLSLGEVARRMGMRTPSLYVYFDSKNAVYDAVFARGWRELTDVMRPSYDQADTAPDLAAFMLEDARIFVGWMLEHPVHAQLMCWRPVPGYEPSPEAYAPAVDLLEGGRVLFERLQARGLFRPELDVGELLRTWTVLTSGVMSQQLANAPHEPLDGGTYTSTLPDLVSMFVTHYGRPGRPGSRGKKQT